MKTVLVIDDSEFMRDRLREILEGLKDYVIFEAVNGKEGIEKYKEQKLDLVFLDINMPEQSGRDTLVQIINFNPEAEVIMCSCMGQDNIIAECIEEGALFYLLKPFTRVNVEEVLKELV